MTNREWLIWKLIDMSDEEFAARICGDLEIWSCSDCKKYGVNNHVFNKKCEDTFRAWLKQEHKENSNEL